jgi:hypothetical protein
MSLELQKEKAQIRRLDFDRFSRLYREQLVRWAARTAAAIPTHMYGNDNRFDIGHMSARAFERDFACMTVDENSPTGHDLFYEDGGVDDYVSLKFNKNTFQKIGSRGYLLAPGQIILKNFQGVKHGRVLSEDTDFNFDYLFAVGYEIIDWNKRMDLFNEGVSAKVIYGMAKRDTVMKHVVESSADSDRLLIKLKNEDWDYCSGYQVVPLNVDRSALNVIYKQHKRDMWDSLLSQVKEN